VHLSTGAASEHQATLVLLLLDLLWRPLLLLLLQMRCQQLLLLLHLVTACCCRGGHCCCCCWWWCRCRYRCCWWLRQPLLLERPRIHAIRLPTLLLLLLLVVVVVVLLLLLLVEASCRCCRCGGCCCGLHGLQQLALNLASQLLWHGPNVGVGHAGGSTAVWAPAQQQHKGQPGHSQHTNTAATGQRRQCDNKPPDNSCCLTVSSSTDTDRQQTHADTHTKPT
jgi:hypothetical protein